MIVLSRKAEAEVESWPTYSPVSIKIWMLFRLKEESNLWWSELNDEIPNIHPLCLGIISTRTCVEPSWAYRGRCNYIIISPPMFIYSGQWVSTLCWCTFIVISLSVEAKTITDSPTHPASNINIHQYSEINSVLFNQQRWPFDKVSFCGWSRVLFVSFKLQYP